MDTTFKVGDGVRWACGTDCNAGTITRVTPNAVYVRADTAKLENPVGSNEPDALVFQAGGFVGHTSGTQRYTFSPGDGPEIQFSKRRAMSGQYKLVGTSSRGSMRPWGVLALGRYKHYDYNF